MTAQQDDSNSVPFGEGPKEQLQKMIFESTFAMLAKLASADGTTSKVEVLAIDKFIKNVLQLNPVRREFAIGVFNQSRKSTQSFKDYATQYRDLLKDKPEMYEWMLDVLLRVSLADHTLSESEEAILNQACRIFSISPEKFEGIKARYIKKTDDKHYRTLGISSDCSLAELETNYNKAREQYDPQRISDLGLPEDFLKLATEKYAELETAYREILKERAGS